MTARPSELTVHPLTPPLAHHGEGPVWDPVAGVLHWVDMLAGDLLTSADVGGPPDAIAPGIGRRHLGDDVLAMVRPRAGGGLVLARGRRFALLDADAGEARLLPELWSDPSVRLNEGSCDPQGRLYCGSMAYDAAPGRGDLRRLDPDGSVEVVLSGVTVSNGLGWDPDGATAFYVDSTTQRVDAFAHDPITGTFADRRPFVAIPPEAGLPDGLAVDADGGVWVALFGGGAVHRYAPDGRLDVRVEVPVRQVTAVTFGGPDLDHLIVTTSRVGVADPEDLAGALFGCRTTYRGQPTLAFGG